MAIPALDNLETMQMVAVMAIALVVITGLRALADYWNTVGCALLGNRVLSDVRSELYRHLQCLSLSFHTKARGGDLLVRVVGDVNMLKDVAVTAFLPRALLDRYPISAIVVGAMLGHELRATGIPAPR